MGRRISAVQARNHDLLNEELEQDLKDPVFRARMTVLHNFLEPWELIDTTVEHDMMIELDSEGPNRFERFRCSCGVVCAVDQPSRARQAARAHRGHVLRAQQEEKRDVASLSLVDRLETAGGPKFRWACDACNEHGAWLESESVATVGSILHHDTCDAWRSLRGNPVGGRRA